MMKTWILVPLLAIIAHADMPDPLVFENGDPVRNAADWQRRQGEIRNTIASECFGVNPVDRPQDLSYEVVKEDKAALGGKAIRKDVKFTFSGPGGSMSFEAILYIPKSSRPAPAFLLMCHRPTDKIDLSVETDNPFWPVETIVSRGYATVAFDANEVDEDKHDAFQGGVHAIFDQGERADDAWGTLAAWAWACSRVMDYLETDPMIDQDKVAVLGHSRGGKTALWAGANDERFSLVISNNSGCSGAAIARRKEGERIADIIRFRHWFCSNYDSYANREDALPFDAHMLIALTAPRLVYVASASEDDWADPEGEFAGAVLASEVYEKLGHAGLSEKTFPEIGQAIQGGRVGYHLRPGPHGLEVFDWERYMDFTDKHW